MKIFLVWILATLIAASTIDIGPDDNIVLNININRELSLAFQIWDFEKLPLNYSNLNAIPRIQWIQWI